MSRRKLFLFLILLATTLLLVNGVVAAKGERAVVATTTSTTCESIPGTEWMDGTVLHVRDQVNIAIETSDHPLLNGVGEIVINYDIDVATGEGVTWGSWVNESSSVDGSWVGVYHGTFSGFVLTNRSVAYGTGELADYHRLGKFDGFIPIPDPPPCDAPLEAETWTVLLVERE